MCLFAIHISSLVKYLFISFSSFLMRLFFIVGLQEFFIGSRYESLVRHVVFKYFLTMCDLSFFPLIRSLQEQSICLQCGRPRFNPWVGKISWRRKWQPIPVFLPGESQGQRSLVGHSPWCHKELDTTERLHFTSLSLHGL